MGDISRFSLRIAAVACESFIRATRALRYEPLLRNAEASCQEQLGLRRGRMRAAGRLPILDRRAPNQAADSRTYERSAWRLGADENTEIGKLKVVEYA